MERKSGKYNYRGDDPVVELLVEGDYVLLGEGRTAKAPHPHNVVLGDDVDGALRHEGEQGVIPEWNGHSAWVAVVVQEGNLDLGFRQGWKGKKVHD